jgi:hypothetical protein
VEVCEVVLGSVAELCESFVEVGCAHFVVEVEDGAGGLWVGVVAEWLLSGDGGGDDG